VMGSTRAARAAASVVAAAGGLPSGAAATQHRTPLHQGASVAELCGLLTVSDVQHAFDDARASGLPGVKPRQLQRLCRQLVARGTLPQRGGVSAGITASAHDGRMWLRSAHAHVAAAAVAAAASSGLPPAAAGVLPADAILAAVNAAFPAHGARLAGDGQRGGGDGPSGLQWEREWMQQQAGDARHRPLLLPSGPHNSTASRVWPVNTAVTGTGLTLGHMRAAISDGRIGSSLALRVDRASIQALAAALWARLEALLRDASNSGGLPTQPLTLAQLLEDDAAMDVLERAGRPTNGQRDGFPPLVQLSSSAPAVRLRAVGSLMHAVCVSGVAHRVVDSGNWGRGLRRVAALAGLHRSGDGVAGTPCGVELQRGSLWLALAALQGPAGLSALLPGLHAAGGAGVTSSSPAALELQGVCAAVMQWRKAAKAAKRMDGSGAGASTSSIATDAVQTLAAAVVEAVPAAAQWLSEALLPQWEPTALQTAVCGALHSRTPQQLAALVHAAASGLRYTADTRPYEGFVWAGHLQRVVEDAHKTLANGILNTMPASHVVSASGQLASVVHA